MSIEKINKELNEFKCSGKVEFTIAGYPTVEEWIQNESEENVKSLLFDVFEQLKSEKE
jgi:hypothetical protein